MPRYINAVETAEMISKAMNTPLDELVDIMAEVPTADVQEVRHWISVKDRLPNPEERVLVFVKALGKIDNIHKDVITTNWITSSGNWIDNWKGIGNYIITHWMPLPDPPSTTDGGDTNT